MIEAFEWLLEQFQLYAHGKLTWVDVQQVLADASHVLASHKPPEDSDDRME